MAYPVSLEGKVALVMGGAGGIDLFDDRAYQIPTAYIDPVSRQLAGRTARPITA